MYDDLAKSQFELDVKCFHQQHDFFGLVFRIDVKIEFSLTTIYAHAPVVCWVLFVARLKNWGYYSVTPRASEGTTLKY